MDSLAVNSRKSFHIRSNSLPSKSHPIVSQVDEHLCRLKASETTSSSSSSSSFLCHKLDGLQDLHNCIDKLLLLPLTQQALSHESDNKWVDDLLESSLMLLDLCDMAKDALLQTKESAHELESILRRRRGCEMGFASEIQKYLNTRKMVKKTIQKALKGIKKSQKSDDSSDVVRLLKEVESVTNGSFESLLSYVAGSEMPSKSSRWNLVSNLVSRKVVCKEENTNINEVATVDAALCSIASHGTNKSDFDDLQNSLRIIQSSIQDLVDNLESLYRRLIKNRVSLLNILNH